jgi:hypothetical protein
MRRSALALLLPLSFALGACEQITSHEAGREAKARVTAVFKGIQAGDTSKERQDATFQWYDGSLISTDPQTYEEAVDEFDSWLRESGLGDGIGTYEVLDAELEQGSQPPVAIVYGTVDGRDFSMRVVDGERIEWVKRPR